MVEADGGTIFLEGNHKPGNEGKPLESGKSKGWILPGASRRNAALLTHKFLPYQSYFWISDPQNCKIMHLYCSKLLHFW